MPHYTPLIGTIVVSLSAAFVLGVLAQRLGLSALVGYLLAGIVVGPFTPGFVGDLPLAAELAELGVILLMFGVGLHFSLADLLAVRAIAIPGALVQMIAAIDLPTMTIATVTARAQGSVTSTPGLKTIPTATKNSTANASRNGSASSAAR